MARRRVTRCSHASPTARAGMAEPDERMVHIVGVNRQTVVSVRRTTAGFEYGSNRTATAPCRWPSPRLPGLKTFYAEESHGNLASNPQIIDAIVDLIRAGDDPRSWRAGCALEAVPERRIDDVQLRIGRCREDRLAAARFGAARGGHGGSRRAGGGRARFCRFARLRLPRGGARSRHSPRQRPHSAERSRQLPIPSISTQMRCASSRAARFLPSISHIAAPTPGQS